MRARVGRVEQPPQNLAAGGARTRAMRRGFHRTHPFNSHPYNSMSRFFARDLRRSNAIAGSLKFARKKFAADLVGRGPAARRRDQDGATASRQGEGIGRACRPAGVNH